MAGFADVKAAIAQVSTDADELAVEVKEAADRVLEALANAGVPSAEIDEVLASLVGTADKLNASTTELEGIAAEAPPVEEEVPPTPGA